MNILLLLLEVLVVFILMILFYKLDKKNGLYIYICLLASSLSVMLTESIDFLSFRVNINVPVIIGVLICNNVIIQKFGIDEVKRIMYTFGISYVITYVIVTLSSLIYGGELFISNDEVFNNLLGYGIDNMRCFVGSFISMLVMIFIGSGIYYSIRKNKNILVVSNSGTIFVVSFVESLVFILISYIGNFTLIELFGMISIRYVLEVIVGILGCIPIYWLVKYIDK